MCNPGVVPAAAAVTARLEDLMGGDRSAHGSDTPLMGCPQPAMPSFTSGMEETETLDNLNASCESSFMVVMLCMEREGH